MSSILDVDIDVAMELTAVNIVELIVRALYRKVLMNSCTHLRSAGDSGESVACAAYCGGLPYFGGVHGCGECCGIFAGLCLKRLRALRT